MTTLKKKKIEELKDAESRQFFYEEHIETGLPIQIRELRKKRGLTQKRLSEITGFDPSNLSNFENPNYEYTPQIGTLQRLANAFDVPLIVRFGSWEELLEWDNTLSPEKVAPENFDEYVERVEKESESKPSLTLIVSNSTQNQQTFQFQKGELHLVSSREIATDDEGNRATGDTQTAKIAAKAAGGAR